MKIVKLVQGTPEWHKHRAAHFNASDAPVMLGCSKYKTRSQLVKELATGYESEPDAATQRIFYKGHRFEALARPIAVDLVGDDLYPVTGVEGKYSASFDGITLDHGVAFEHKTMNVELYDIMKNGCEGSDLPKMYRVQMEHQLMVSGAAKCLFMASSWDENDELDECMECWYYSDQELRNEIIAGWDQLLYDVENYQHVEEDQPAVAGVVTSLPAVSVEVSGEITVVSNLEKFGAALSDFVENQLIKDPETDQDFADLEAQIKTLKKAEKALDDEERRALSQIQAVSDMRELKGVHYNFARDNRLLAEKLVKAKKESIRAKIIEQSKAEYLEHLSSIDETLGGKVKMPVVMPDFAGAIKGKKTMASLRDAAATELANAKASANRQADAIRLNLETLRADSAGFEVLFYDAQELVLKDSDDLKAVIKSRIADAKAAEAERAQKESAPAPADSQKSQEKPAPKQQDTGRPSDGAIIGAVADAFGVDGVTARKWILDVV